MRSVFDEQLLELNHDMIQMGSFGETAIATACASLLEGNPEKAKSVPDILEQMDSLGREIENLCLRLLLRQQPVASDLRTISSALKMVTDMNRIGVQSNDIAEIVMLGNIRNWNPDLPVKEMAQGVIHMVTDAIGAFVRKNQDMAQSVVDYDDVIDKDFDIVRAELVKELQTPGANGEEVLDLLMVCKYLERIGDHAVNIAEWVIFSITGEHGKVN